MLSCAAALMLVPVPAASANVKWDSCPAGGDVAYAGTYYVEAGTYDNKWRVNKQQFTIDNNNQDHNNVSFRLRGQEGFLYWAWTSGDNIDGGDTYTIYDIGVLVPKNVDARMVGHFIFDQFGPDPSCDTFAFLND